MKATAEEIKRVRSALRESQDQFAARWKKTRYSVIRWQRDGHWFSLDSGPGGSCLFRSEQSDAGIWRAAVADATAARGSRRYAVRWNDGGRWQRVGNLRENAALDLAAELVALGSPAVKKSTRIVLHVNNQEDRFHEKNLRYLLVF